MIPSASRHSRAGGNPVYARNTLDSRLRGYDARCGEAVTHRTPQEIMEEIAALDAESAGMLENIKGLVA